MTQAVHDASVGEHLFAGDVLCEPFVVLEKLLPEGKSSLLARKLQLWQTTHGPKTSLFRGCLLQKVHRWQ